MTILLQRTLHSLFLVAPQLYILRESGQYIHMHIYIHIVVWRARLRSFLLLSDRAFLIFPYTRNTSKHFKGEIITSKYEKQQQRKTNKHHFICSFTHHCIWIIITIIIL